MATLLLRNPWYHPHVRAVALIVAMVAAAAVFSPALGAGFLSDDFEIVNAVRAGQCPLTIHRSFLRPLTVLSLALDHALWGLDPVGYHMTNLVLHLTSALLVLVVVLELSARLAPAHERTVFAAALSAALFVLLPSHSEPVAWISGRADLLATALCLASMWAYLSHRRAGGRARLVVSLFLFALALASKESVVTFPLIVLMGEVWLQRSSEGRRTSWRMARVPLLYAAMLAAFWGLRWALLGSAIAGYGSTVHLRVDPIHLLVGPICFIARTVVPPLPVAGLAILSLALVVAAGLWVWRSSGSIEGFPGAARRCGFALAACLLALLPVLTLSISKTTTEGERFVYWPSAFAVMAVALTVERGLRRRRWRIVVTSILLAGCAAVLWRSSMAWSGAGSVARTTLASAARLAEREHLCVINLPDSIAGAYILRNGFEEGLKVSGDRERFGRVTVLVRHTLMSPGDEVIVRRDGSRVTVELPSPGAVFTAGSVSALVRWSGVDVVSQAPQRLELEVPPQLCTDPVSFTHGELRELE